MTTELAKTLIVTSIIITTLFILTSCALLDRLRGVANPHSEMLIEVPVVEDVEDIRG